MQLIITHMSGPRDGEALLIEAAGSPPAVTFGRNLDCTVALPDDPEISRQHARLVWRGGNWSLEDLRSTNGTFVNEFALQQRIAAPIGLEAGAVFRVGLSRFRVESADSLKNARLMTANRVR